MKYFVDDKNPRIVTKVGEGYFSIIGDTPIPVNAIISWDIVFLGLEKDNGDKINIGVAPSNINQSTDGFTKRGWYFYCWSSTLFSGPPHEYRDKGYGPRKGNGQYVRTGDRVGVVMDTIKGELSFVLGGINLGVAYRGIPLDKPLVPCVILGNECDSIELETKE